MLSARSIPRLRTSLLASTRVDRARVLDTLVNNLDGMAYRCHLDHDWTMVFVSQGCLALTGYPADVLVGANALSWEAVTDPSDRQRVRGEIDAAVRSARRFAVEYRIRTREGDTKWVLERGIPVPDERGCIVIEGFVEDITEHRAMVAALEHAELRYRHIFEHASEGIFQTTPEGRYLAANPALAKLYGYAGPDELIADLAELDRRLYVEPGRRAAFRRLMETHGEVRNFESEVYRRDGSRIWISENAHIVRGSDGRLICYEGTVQDVSERRHYEAQLERQANHDQLTGLPNRNLLRDRIEQGIARAARRGCMLALVFIDLDGFKFINDSLGHAAGDELLVEIAGRLNASIRSSDTVGRLGGDEFVLVLNDHEQLGSVISTLERVLQDIGRPAALAGRELQVGASLGVAMYPDDGDDADSLLKHADVAMYAAKSRGRNNFQFFTRALNSVAEERLTLEAAMRVAIERDEFEVHYQPKLDHRRRIVGMEALARWFHPVLGDIRPDRFIPIAEECGLILPTTTCILRKMPSPLLGRVATALLPGGESVAAPVPEPGHRRSCIRPVVRCGAAGLAGRAGGDGNGLPRRRRAGRRHLPCVQGAWPQPGDGRLRHGLLVAQLPAPLPARHHQDRPLAGRRHRAAGRDGDDRARSDLARSEPAQDGGRGRRREPGAVRLPALSGLRRVPGLPVLAPAARGRLRASAGSRRRHRGPGRLSGRRLQEQAGDIDRLAPADGVAVPAQPGIGRGAAECVQLAEEGAGGVEPAGAMDVLELARLDQVEALLQQLALEAPPRPERGRLADMAPGVRDHAHLAQEGGGEAQFHAACGDVVGTAWCVVALQRSFNASSGCPGV